jgi:hypothetical protein
MIKIMLALSGCFAPIASIWLILPAMGGHTYAIFGIVLGEAAILVAAYRTADDPMARLSLSTAIRCVAIGAAIGLLWPAALVLGVIWFIACGCRGVGQRAA